MLSFAIAFAGAKFTPERYWVMGARVYNLAFITLPLTCLAGCKANVPSATEEKVAAETKKVTIKGKDWKNPIPTAQLASRTGRHIFNITGRCAMARMGKTQECPLPARCLHR